jgi:hypothetical protein
VTNAVQNVILVSVLVLNAYTEIEDLNGECAYPDSKRLVLEMKTTFRLPILC